MSVCLPEACKPREGGHLPCFSTCASLDPPQQRHTPGVVLSCCLWIHTTSEPALRSSVAGLRVPAMTRQCPESGPGAPTGWPSPLHPERWVWVVGSWGCGDWSSRAQSHVSGLSPGPPRRPRVHTCVPGLKAGGGWAAWSQEEHRTSSEVWASPASLPAPETLPRAATRSPERGCCPCPGGAGTGLPAEGPLDDSSRAVGGQPRVLTLRAPPLAPPGRASCPSSLLQPLGLALERAGCWRGDGGHGQSASLCPGFVPDFTLSEGPHVSCVRLSGDESPRAGRTEPTHQPGPRGLPPPAPDPACRCQEGAACSRDLCFLQTSTFFFPGRAGDLSLSG